jgi:hypothetical protein
MPTKRKPEEGEVLCLAHKDGRVVDPATGKLLRCSINSDGYRVVFIDGKHWRVSRIIALGFLLQNDGLITQTDFMKWQIDHGAAGKLCNAVSNLKALTSEEHHKVTAERAKAAGENPWALTGATQGRPCEYRRLLRDDEEETDDMWTRVVSRAEAGRRTGISAGMLCEHLSSRSALARGEPATWLCDGGGPRRVRHEGWKFRDVSAAAQKSTPSTRRHSTAQTRLTGRFVQVCGRGQRRRDVGARAGPVRRLRGFNFGPRPQRVDQGPSDAASGRRV